MADIYIKDSKGVYKSYQGVSRVGVPARDGEFIIFAEEEELFNTLINNRYGDAQQENES